MSRIVNVTSGNYVVRVQNSGTITLNTGDQVGTVIVTGDLSVLGNTTTMSTTNVTIEDNILTLNKGETGAGVTLDRSGIEIDRGPATSWARLLFDEDVSHYNPVTGGTDFGTWKVSLDNGTIGGIFTNSIATGGGDLALINSGTGVVTVTGTAFYEEQLFPYSGHVMTSLTPTDPDNIPNVQALVDYTALSLALFDDDRILEGDTKVEVHDLSEGDGPSRITFDVDGSELGQFNASGFDVGNIRLNNNTITNTSGNNLVVTATNNNVQITGVVNLDNYGSSVSATAGTSKIYSKSSLGAGNSGIYFANTSKSDELVSKSRALLFSMLF